MPRSSRANAHYSVENAPTLTRSPSRESGFVLGLQPDMHRRCPVRQSLLIFAQMFSICSQELTSIASLRKGGVTPTMHSGRIRLAAAPVIAG
jgi:hypothetical protein